MKVENLGRTTEGRPLQLVWVGAPTPKPVAEEAQGSVALFVCSAHGDEPSGRAAFLHPAPDLALSTDAAVNVNANPDGAEGGPGLEAGGAERPARVRPPREHDDTDLLHHPGLRPVDQGRRNVLLQVANIVGMLSETANARLNDAEEDDPALLNRRRVNVDDTSALGSISWSRSSVTS